MASRIRVRRLTVHWLTPLHPAHHQRVLLFQNLNIFITAQLHLQLQFQLLSPAAVGRILLPAPLQQMNPFHAVIRHLLRAGTALRV